MDTRQIFSLSQTTSPSSIPSPVIQASGAPVIPLIGGADPQTGKQPAVAWRDYQNSPSTPEEHYQWFVVEGYTAYGVICGNGQVILDGDDGMVAQLLENRFPDLCDTLTVQSGVRGTPHWYWKTDFPVRSQRVFGGDLKGEGSYVVGPGSRIGDHHWQVIKDRPIRTLTRAELQQVLDFLKSIEEAVSGSVRAERWERTASSPTWSMADLKAIYTHETQQSGQRNNSLFKVACLARDGGCGYELVVQALADLHAGTRPQQGQLQEPYQRRYHEAVNTIASAFSRPPRDWTIEQEGGVSCLPNALRESLLPRDDGVAILRVLEGLILNGVQAGDELTEKVMVARLKGYVGRYSIRKALQADLTGNLPLFQAFVRSCPANKNAVFCSESAEEYLSAPAGGVWGVQRPPRVYRMPDLKTLCAYLEIEFGHGDPITLDDIKSPRAYREALELRLIRRRPGAYSQHWLAQRLGISDRTIRRYHCQLPIFSRRRYIDRDLGWWNVYELLPAGDETGGGRCLIDETGKSYPALRSIALRLLKAGHRLIYRMQTCNTYWVGAAEPDWLAATMQKEGYEKQLPVMNNRPALLNKSQSAAPVNIEPPATAVAKVEHEMVYVRRIEPPPQPIPDNPPDRFFQQALPDPADEQVALRVYRTIADLSQANARRLVYLYGRSVVEPTLRRACYLIDKGKVRNPAGFMVTAVQGAWRSRHGWQVPKPEFKAQPVRQRRKPYDVMKDPLSKSEKWLRWRIWLAYEMNDQVSVDRWQGRLVELGYEPEVLYDWQTLIYCEIPF